jgi:hypothetical protein
MRETNQNWGLRVVAVAAVAIGLVFLAQVISFWWIAITAAVSCAVWMMIWLWPERIPERIENDRRMVNKKDSFAGGD